MIHQKTKRIAMIILNRLNTLIPVAIKLPVLSHRSRPRAGWGLAAVGPRRRRSRSGAAILIKSARHQRARQAPPWTAVHGGPRRPRRRAGFPAPGGQAARRGGRQGRRPVDLGGLGETLSPPPPSWRAAGAGHIGSYPERDARSGMAGPFPPKMGGPGERRWTN
jgi:hypothetical protein